MNVVLRRKPGNSSWSRPIVNSLRDVRRSVVSNGFGFGIDVLDERAELAADVLEAVPHRVAVLEEQIAVQIVPRVDLVDRAVRIRTRRAGADLIEVLAARPLEHGLALPGQVVGAR